MTDIVERLKRGTEIKKIDAMGNEHTTFEATLVEHEAADEIDRLRADNERLRAALNKIMRNDPEGYEASIARTALEGKDD